MNDCERGTFIQNGKNGRRLNNLPGDGLSPFSSFTPISTNIKGLKVGYLMGENVTKLEESVAPGFLAVHFLLEKGLGGFCGVLQFSR